MNVITKETVLTAQIVETQTNNSIQLQRQNPSISFDTLVSQAKEYDFGESTVNPEHESLTTNQNTAAEEKSEEVKESKTDKKSEKKEVEAEKKEVSDEEKIAASQLSVQINQNVEKEENIEININEIAEIEESQEIESINLAQTLDENTEVEVSSLLVENQNIKEIALEEKSQADEKIELNLNSENDENFIAKSDLNTKNDKSLVKDDTSKITVKDLRTQGDAKDNNIFEKKNDAKPALDIKINNENTATITMEYASQNVTENVLSMNNQTAGSDGSNFQAMLNNQIQHNIPEIVKTGSIILKDNNQGSINLILHPDDLGNVKIHLSLDGKTVSGHIIVATKEAAEVFKDNAQTLREAFEKNGFDTAGFNVSYNNNSGNGNSSSNQYSDADFLVKQLYDNNVSKGEEGVNLAEITNSSKKDNYSINIVA